jgi:hypothetical protein
MLYHVGPSGRRADSIRPFTTERGGNEEIRKTSSQQIPKLWRLELALRVERLVVADYENPIEQNQLRLLYPSGSVNVTRLEWR